MSNTEQNRPKRNRPAVDYSLLNGGELDLARNDFDKAESQNTYSTPQDANVIPQKKVKNDHKRSWVWEHLNVIPTGELYLKSGREVDEFLIKCRYVPCDWSILESKRNQSTSNMIRHLQHAHNIDKGSAVVNLHVTDSHSNIEQFEEKLVMLFVTKNLPFNLIECEEFRCLLRISPSFASPATLLRRIVSKYDEGRMHLQRLLDETCFPISLSLDIWTSTVTGSYLAIVGHWIGEDYKYHERLIDFIELEGQHTGENIAKVVIDVLKSLGIASKLLSITMDNASYNDKLSVVLDDELEQLIKEGHIEKKKFDGTNSIIRCIAHILNLIVKSILDNLKSGTAHEVYKVFDKINNHEQKETLNALMKIRAIPLYVKQSLQRKNQWLQLIPKDSRKKFIQFDVETRGNSTYNMLDDAFIFQSEITQFVINYNLTDFIITPSEWAKLACIKEVLGKFEQLTRYESKRAPQIISFLGVYYELYDILNDIIEKQHNFHNIPDDVLDAVKKSITKYEKYYKLMDTCDLYYIAATLDPMSKSE